MHEETKIDRLTFRIKETPPASRYSAAFTIPIKNAGMLMAGVSVSKYVVLKEQFLLLGYKLY